MEGITKMKIMSMIMLFEGTGRISFDRFLNALVDKMHESDLEDEVRGAFRREFLRIISQMFTFKSDFVS